MERRDPAAVGRSPATGGAHHLPQLTVLVPPTVVPGVRRLLPIVLALARDAKTYARQRLAAPCRDLVAALLALEQALAARQAAARTLDGVLDARVNLILHGPVTSPAAGHLSPLSRGFETSPDHDTPRASLLRQFIEPQSWSPPGGRVFLFLTTDDFWRDYRAYRSRGVEFQEDPRREEYGMVAVFADRYGNRWDLIEGHAR